MVDGTLRSGGVRLKPQGTFLQEHNWRPIRKCLRTFPLCPHSSHTLVPSFIVSLADNVRGLSAVFPPLQSPLRGAQCRSPCALTLSVDQDGALCIFLHLPSPPRPHAASLVYHSHRMPSLKRSPACEMCPLRILRETTFAASEKKSPALAIARRSAGPCAGARTAPASSAAPIDSNVSYNVWDWEPLALALRLHVVVTLLGLSNVAMPQFDSQSFKKA